MIARRTAHGARRTAHGARRTTHDARRTTHDTRHTTHDTRHTTHDTRHTTHDTRHTTHDTRHTTHDTRHTTHDTRHTTHDTPAGLASLSYRTTATVYTYLQSNLYIGTLSKSNTYYPIIARAKRKGTDRLSYTIAILFKACCQPGSTIMRHIGQLRNNLSITFTCILVSSHVTITASYDKYVQLWSIATEPRLCAILLYFAT